MTSPRRKILLLDDDPEIAALLRISFASMPYDATVVESGLDAAIQIFEAYKSGQPFEALILDCALPRMDGFTLGRIVRLCEAQGISPRAKIGYFTAFDKTVKQSTLLDEVGAEAYWAKPGDTPYLPELIAFWLE